MNKYLNLGKNKGFTLVELLVVMAILGILVALVAGAFRTPQMKGRDAKRKGDLKELANALELFINDYGMYPSSSPDGKILGCPYPDDVAGCEWGAGEFADGKTIYYKVMPNDPSKNGDYVYVVPDSANSKYMIFTRLENSEDKDCIEGDCTGAVTGRNCGSGLCNYAVTSTNTSYLGN